MFDIIEKAKKSDLYRYGWNVHRPQVEERKNFKLHKFTEKKEENINVEKELEYFNLLHLRYNLSRIGHLLFEVTEIISIKRDYFSVFIFSSRKQYEKKSKVSLQINSTNILGYFNNIVYPAKTKQLHSFSIARSICHLSVQIDGHNLTYDCDCFSCRICRILLTTLLSRRHQKLLQIVKK